MASRVKTYFLENKIGVFFWIFVLVYAALFLINPQLGPTDDFVFLRTLQAGKPLIYASPSFPYYDWLGFGRFSVLTSLEYDFVGIFSNSPFWYFFYHTIQFIVFAFLLVKLLEKITDKKWLVYLSSILLFLMPAFTISWFRLQLPERNVIFLFAALLLCYLAFLKEQKNIYLIMGILFANLALYYKETSFMAILALAVGYLLLDWKNSNRKIKIFNFLLIGSSFLYLILYYFLIYLHSNPFVLQHKENWSLLILSKGILNYAFFSDQIILLLIPFTLWRIYKVFIQHEPAHPFFDALLGAGSAYVLAFFALGLYGTYYFLPIYILAIPALIYFFAKKEFKSWIWKVLGLIAGFLILTNALPAGIHYLTYNKYLPINFNQTLDFLIQDIKTRHPKDRASIFLDGIDLKGGRGTYFIFGEFMQYKGLSGNRFDLKSNVTTTNPEPLVSKISPPFTVFNSDNPSIIKSGDYLIVPPQNTKAENSQSYLKTLEKDYNPVFQAKGELAFPAYTLKTLIKYLASQHLSAGQKAKGLVVSEDLSDQPNYYVFVKK